MSTDLEKLFQVARASGMLAGIKDLPTGTSDPVAQGSGPFGLFNVPGLEQELISTHLVGSGLAMRLPAYGTRDLWPFFGYITGVQDVPNDTPADGECDPPPTVGHIKGCMESSHFGLYSYRTREYNLKRAGERVNRADPEDLVIVNNPLLNQLAPITPNTPGSIDFRREALTRMFELGVAFQRKLARQLYIGDPANATNGGYDEFPGLDILVATGHKDAKTGTVCPSIDSLIVDFADADLSSTLVDGYGNDQNALFYTLIGVFHYLQSLADDTGLTPVKWVLAMRRDLFWELSALWPCIYQTNRCAFVDQSGTTSLVVDSGDMIRMRDDMRQNSYIPIEGGRIEVVMDPFIVEENHSDNSAVPAGFYASDMYIVPLTAGPIVSTYWQYFDYQGAYGPLDAAQDWRVSQFFWTDGGRYLWESDPPVNGCVVLEATIRPRVILRTPHLAARIKNIAYNPGRHTRDIHPQDHNYVNGGVTSRTLTEPGNQLWS